MSQIDDGGSAFPVIPPVDDSGRGSTAGYPFPDSGMSLRDWFAGQAMIGVGRTYGFSDSGRKDACTHAYKMADAMLEARKK